MKRIIFLSVMMLVTIASFGRKHVENATVVADTIFYAENMSNVANADQPFMQSLRLSILKLCALLLHRRSAYSTYSW